MDKETEQQKEIETRLKARWAHLLEPEDEKEIFEYVNYAYDIEHLEKVITDLVLLEHHEEKLNKWVR